jgi:hypothetical protein
LRTLQIDLFKRFYIEQMTIFINLIVTASNFVFPIFCKMQGVSPPLLAYVPMLASALYHISERKHGLPGVAPFNAYSNELIWADRVGAFASGAFVLYKTGLSPSPVNLAVAAGGFACLTVSEHDIIFQKLGWGHFHVNKWLFAVTHTVWHTCAFYLLASALAN